ncbi:MAG: HAD-IA family hydrolase [Leptolyngbyaceae cyanobacterium MO_188.B28]|nr:HAD-IA family hydrolase [Leptolyngbyaceae cyanobacterium MO_188.B28]
MAVIIFDFDGTIADTLAAIAEIANRLAPLFGFSPAGPEKIKFFQTLSTQQLLQQSEISVFKLPFLLRRVKTELRREIQQLNLIPGVRDALIALSNEGHTLGIVTSNSADNVHLFLKKHDLADLFSFIHTGTALFGKSKVLKQVLRRNQLNADQVLYIGDETRDIEAAQKIPIRVVAVSWGFNSHQVLMSKKPDFLIDHPNELMQIVTQLEGVKCSR